MGDLNVAKVAKNNFAKTQIGTPYYLAPEIWKNNLYDFRCDIFSLGVVIYEMAALRVPFEASTIQELQRKICQGFIQRIPSRYSDDLYEVIKSMMNVNPRLRPTTEELIQNSFIRRKMSEFGYLDVKEEERYETLINTIVVPRNLNQLHKNLPKEKKYEIKSCQDLDPVERKPEELKEQLQQLPSVRNPPLQPKLNFNKKVNQEVNVVGNFKAQIQDEKRVKKMKYEEYLQ